MAKAELNHGLMLSMLFDCQIPERVPRRVSDGVDAVGYVPRVGMVAIVTMQGQFMLRTLADNGFGDLTRGNAEAAIYARELEDC